MASPTHFRLACVGVAGLVAIADDPSGADPAHEPMARPIVDLMCVDHPFTWCAWPVSMRVVRSARCRVFSAHRLGRFLRASGVLEIVPHCSGTAGYAPSRGEARRPSREERSSARSALRLYANMIRRERRHAPGLRANRPVVAPTPPR